MLLVAIFFWQVARRAKWPVFFNAIYFGALTLLFGGTAFLHATLTEMGQWTDGLGLYAVILFVLCYFIALRLRWSKKSFALAYLGSLAVCGIFAWHFMQFRVALFGILVMVSFLTILGLRGTGVGFRKRDLAFAGGFFLFGLVFQILDRKLILCSRYSFWQGHALWHVLSAIATYFLGTLMLHAKYEPRSTERSV